MLRGVSVLKKMLHSGQIWDQKGAIIKLVQKKIPFKFVLGWLADADGAVGGFSSKEKDTQKNGIAINAIDNKK